MKYNHPVTEQPNFFKRTFLKIPFLGNYAKQTWHFVKRQKKQLRNLVRAVHGKVQLPNALNELTILLERVEHYQPLYHFPTIKTNHPHRDCVDRAETVFRAMQTFGNGGRILDIGCSLGYFSYYFADRGYQAEGIDMHPDNIAICKLQQYAREEKLLFSVAEFSPSFLKKNSRRSV